MAVFTIMEAKIITSFLSSMLVLLLLGRTSRAYDISDIDDDIMPPAPRGEIFTEALQDNSPWDAILRDNDEIEKEIAEGRIRHVLIDGDIYNPEETNSTSRSKRNSVKERSKLWPGGVVPYVIDQYFHRDSKLAILSAMQRFHDRTCIRFVPRTIERDFIHVSPGRGCWSLVGRQGSKQTVSLGASCKNTRGTIMHEMMHVLGFRHEHNRPDRDRHVNIYWDNIPTAMKDNFKKYSYGSVDLLGAQYDFGSIMHYPMYAFSKNGAATLSPRYTTYKELGFRNDFSDLDVYRINHLYKCGACQDTDHHHCPTWAMGGSCQRNRDWMSKNCAYSCSMCKVNSYGACVDHHNSCDAWAKVGECRRNPQWMKRTCPLSCGGCPLDLRNRRDEMTGHCQDWTTLCNDWAYLGECVANAGYMNKRCKYSCGTCKAGDKSSHPWTYKKRGECRDRNPYCPKWAETNMCIYNPSVMRETCKESCNLCPQIPDCFDKHDTKTCKRWAWMGDCITNREGTKNLCQKSCGHCGEREGCRDLNRRCIKWARDGYCKTSAKFMRKYCAPSCGICTPSPEELEEDQNILGGEHQGNERQTKAAKAKAKAAKAKALKKAKAAKAKAKAKAKRNRQLATTSTPSTVRPTTEEPTLRPKKGKKKKKKNKNKKTSPATTPKRGKGKKKHNRRTSAEILNGQSALRPGEYARVIPAWRLKKLQQRLDEALAKSREIAEAKALKLAAQLEGTDITPSDNPDVHNEDQIDQLLEALLNGTNVMATQLPYEQTLNIDAILAVLDATDFAPTDTPDEIETEDNDEHPTEATDEFQTVLVPQDNEDTVTLV